MTPNWSTIKPTGMVGTGASACRFAVMSQGLGFAAARPVHVYATGNDGIEWPMGPTGDGTG